MEYQELKQKLRDMNSGETFQFPTNLPPEQVDQLLDQLGWNGENISADWNGCDLDWSGDLDLDGMGFELWGSGYSGSIMFQKD